MGSLVVRMMPRTADRYALLEAVAGTLVLVGLWLGWRWIADGGVRWAVATGVVLGLAGCSKLNALVVLAPVVVVGVAYVWGRRRLLLETSALLGAAVVAFLLPFFLPQVLLYAAGTIASAVLYAKRRFAITAAADLYRAILVDIEAHDYDVFSRRAHIGAVGKLARLPRIWHKSKRA